MLKKYRLWARKGVTQKIKVDYTPFSPYDLQEQDKPVSGAGACVGGDCGQKFGGDYQCDYHGDYHGNDCDQKLSDNYHGRNDWEEAQTITTTGPETFL